LTTQVGGGEGVKIRLPGAAYWVIVKRKSDAGARSGINSTEAIQRAFS
jgi:hypothetical protein